MDIVHNSQWEVLFSEPPSDYPVLTINGVEFNGTEENAEVIVTEGVRTDVSCTVSGGVPATTETKIKCGRRTISGSRRFNRLWNRRTCTCSGEHPSGCYTLETKVKLQVTCKLSHLIILPGLRSMSECEQHWSRLVRSNFSILCSSI